MIQKMHRPLFVIFCCCCIISLTSSVAVIPVEAQPATPSPSLSRIIVVCGSNASGADLRLHLSSIFSGLEIVVGMLPDCKSVTITNEPGLRLKQLSSMVSGGSSYYDTPPTLNITLRDLTFEGMFKGRKAGALLLYLGTLNNIFIKLSRVTALARVQFHVNRTLGYESFFEVDDCRFDHGSTQVSNEGAPYKYVGLWISVQNETSVSRWSHVSVVNSYFHVTADPKFGDHPSSDWFRFALRAVMMEKDLVIANNSIKTKDCVSSGIELIIASEVFTQFREEQEMFGIAGKLLIEHNEISVTCTLKDVCKPYLVSGIKVRNSGFVAAQVIIRHNNIKVTTVNEGVALRWVSDTTFSGSDRGAVPCSGARALSMYSNDAMVNAAVGAGFVFSGIGAFNISHNRIRLAVHGDVFHDDPQATATMAARSSVIGIGFSLFCQLWVRKRVPAHMFSRCETCDTSSSKNFHAVDFVTNDNDISVINSNMADPSKNTLIRIVGIALSSLVIIGYSEQHTVSLAALLFEAHRNTVLVRSVNSQQLRFAQGIATESAHIDLSEDFVSNVMIKLDFVVGSPLFQSLTGNNVTMDVTVVAPRRAAGGSVANPGQERLFCGLCASAGTISETISLFFNPFLVMQMMPKVLQADSKPLGSQWTTTQPTLGSAVVRFGSGNLVMMTCRGDGATPCYALHATASNATEQLNVDVDGVSATLINDRASIPQAECNLLLASSTSAAATATENIRDPSVMKVESKLVDEKAVVNARVTNSNFTLIVPNAKAAAQSCRAVFSDSSVLRLVSVHDPALTKFDVRITSSRFLIDTVGVPDLVPVFIRIPRAKKHFLKPFLLAIAAAAAASTSSPPSVFSLSLPPTASGSSNTKNNVPALLSSLPGPQAEAGTSVNLEHLEFGGALTLSDQDGFSNGRCPKYLLPTTVISSASSSSSSLSSSSSSSAFCMVDGRCELSVRCLTPRCSSSSGGKSGLDIDELIHAPEGAWLVNEINDWRCPKSTRTKIVRTPSPTNSKTLSLPRAEPPGQPALVKTFATTSAVVNGVASIVTGQVASILVAQRGVAMLNLLSCSLSRLSSSAAMMSSNGNDQEGESGAAIEQKLDDEARVRTWTHEPLPFPISLVPGFGLGSSAEGGGGGFYARGAELLYILLIVVIVPLLALAFGFVDKRRFDSASSSSSSSCAEDGTKKSNTAGTTTPAGPSFLRHSPIPFGVIMMFSLCLSGWADVTAVLVHVGDGALAVIPLVALFFAAIAAAVDLSSQISPPTIPVYSATGHHLGDRPTGVRPYAVFENALYYSLTSSSEKIRKMRLFLQTDRARWLFTGDEMWDTPHKMSGSVTNMRNRGVFIAPPGPLAMFRSLFKWHCGAHGDPQRRRADLETFTSRQRASLSPFFVFIDVAATFLIAILGAVGNVNPAACSTLFFVALSFSLVHSVMCLFVRPDIVPRKRFVDALCNGLLVVQCIGSLILLLVFRGGATAAAAVSSPAVTAFQIVVTVPVLLAGVVSGFLSAAFIAIRFIAKCRVVSRKAFRKMMQAELDQLSELIRPSSSAEPSTKKKKKRNTDAGDASGGGDDDDSFGGEMLLSRPKFSSFQQLHYQQEYGYEDEDDDDQKFFVSTTTTHQREPRRFETPLLRRASPARPRSSSQRPSSSPPITAARGSERNRLHRRFTEGSPSGSHPNRHAALSSSSSSSAPRTTNNGKNGSDNKEKRSNFVDTDRRESNSNSRSSNYKNERRRSSPRHSGYRDDALL